MAFLFPIPHENILTTLYVFCCGCLLNTFQKKSEGIKTVIHSFIYILLYLRTPAVIFCLLSRNKNLAAKLTGKRSKIFYTVYICLYCAEIYAELKKKTWSENKQQNKTISPRAYLSRLSKTRSEWVKKSERQRVLSQMGI